MRFIAAFILALLWAAPAWAERRVALVIGNQSYQNLSRLANPAGDARAFAALLRGAGFEVIDGYNLTREQFLDKLEAFEHAARGADVALAFYGGHGLQVLNRDVLAPIDMSYDCETRAVARVVDVAKLFEAMAGAATKIVVLDACRNDPFPNCPPRGQGAGDGAGFRGLEAYRAVGTLIVNATSPGQLASDGVAGRNSPFMAAALARLGAGPRKTLRDVFDEVAGDVSRATRAAQALEIRYLGEPPRICLTREGCGVGEAPPELQLPMSEEAMAWSFVKTSDNEAVVEDFIRRHGSGVYGAEARARLEESRKRRVVPKPPAIKTVIASGNPLALSGYEDKQQRLIRTIDRHTNGATLIAVSEDGEIVVSVSRDDNPKLWDARTGLLIREIEAGSSSAVALTRDAKVVVLGTGYDVTLWEANTGRLLQTMKGHVGEVLAVAVTEDGNSIISGGWDNKIKLWHAGTGTLVRTMEGHEGYVSAISLTNNGKTVISGSSDKTVKLWDVETGTLIRTIEAHDKEVLAISVTRDGKSIVSGSRDKTVRLWQAGTGRLAYTMNRHAGFISSVSITADGKTVVSGSKDNTIRLWNAKTGKLVRTLDGHGNSVRSVVVTSDSKTLISSGCEVHYVECTKSTVKLWDISDLASPQPEAGGAPGGGMRYEPVIKKN